VAVLLDLATMVVQETKAAIYAKALNVAEAVGLPVTSWQPGDPTRSYYHVISEVLERVEGVVVSFIKGGYLDYATGDWLKLLAAQVYGVTVPEATFATTDVTLTNAGGGLYVVDIGDLTFLNTSTGKTYRNTTAGTLSPSGTLTLTVVADEAGSASSAGAGEIDDLVTTLLGVTVTNAVAATGTDEQDPVTTRAQCRAKLGALSAAGPADAYHYVALASDLTGTTGITRCKVYGNSTTGDVTVYLAGPSGAISSDDRDAAEAAIIQWAVPLCITPTVLTASNLTVAVTYHLWLYDDVGDDSAAIQAAVLAALQALFAARPIGGDVKALVGSGKVYREHIISAIRAVYPDHAFDVTLTLPAADTAVTLGQVPVLGAVTPTITLEAAP